MLNSMTMLAVFLTDVQQSISVDKLPTVKIKLDGFDWATFANCSLVIVGIGGIVVAVCTLLYIKRQVKVMKSQAAQMEKQTAILADSVTAAKDSAKAAKDQIQLIMDKECARIQVTPLDLEVIELTEPNKIMIEFVNIGPTNAFDVRVEAGGKVTVDGLEPEQGECTDLAIPTLLRPDKTESSWVVCDFPQRWQSQVVDDRARITVELIGQIKYRDVFDVIHIENFSYRMNVYEIENMSRNFVRLKPMRKWHPFDLHPGAWEF
jgi:hypothetical protein